MNNVLDKIQNMRYRLNPSLEKPKKSYIPPDNFGDAMEEIMRYAHVPGGIYIKMRYKLEQLHPNNPMRMLDDLHEFLSAYIVPRESKTVADVEVLLKYRFYNHSDELGGYEKAVRMFKEDALTAAQLINHPLADSMFNFAWEVTPGPLDPYPQVFDTLNALKAFLVTAKKL